MIRNIFARKQATVPISEDVVQTGAVEFSKKYKVIVKKKYTPSYYETVLWLHNNSKGDVDVKVVPTKDHSPADVYFAFELLDDALFFKLRF